MKLFLLAVALALGLLGGCATAPTTAEAAYAGNQVIKAANAATMARLAAHKITPEQAQKVADLEKAVLAGERAAVNAPLGGSDSPEAKALAIAIVALQTYVASLGDSP